MLEDKQLLTDGAEIFEEFVADRARSTYVLFISYFRLLVFAVLVTFWLHDFLSVFICLTYLALQNVNKDYVIFLFHCNLVAKSDQIPKTKNGINQTI